MKSFDDNVKSCLQKHIQFLTILHEKQSELDVRREEFRRKGLDEEPLLEEIQNVHNGVNRIWCNAKSSIIKEVEKLNREGRASNRSYGESSEAHYDQVDDDVDDTYMW